MDFAILKSADTDANRIDEDWGSLTWLASAKLGNAEELTVGRVIIKQGCNNPRHSHPTCEEVLYLIAGTLEHSAGDEVATLHAGDTFTVAAGVFHNAVSTGDVDADMIVTYSDANRTIEHE